MRVTDRTYSILKRAQILTGVIPVGLFLVSHVATNARAIAGSAVFDRAVAAIARIPFLPVLEIGLVALPMLAHVALAVVIGTTAQAAEDRRGYERAWMLAAQRVSGFVLVIYVAFHVWGTRLAPERLAGGSDLFAMTARTLSDPAVLGFHVAGMLAAAFHFGNGLVALAGPWGLDLGERGRRRAAGLGLAASLVLGVVGVHALLAFVNPAFRWLEPHPAAVP